MWNTRGGIIVRSFNVQFLKTCELSPHNESYATRGGTEQFGRV